MSCAMYQKGEGTLGIRGLLYETKLISLIFYRAKRDESIEQFQLASNINNIGAFDDICLKAKVNGLDKPVAVFIQAKLKDDNKQTLNIDLAKYFRSYLKIRERFKPIHEDGLFQGTFEETECFFVIYTSGKDKFDNVLVESDYASKLNDLIDTGGTAKQPYKYEDNVVLLCKVAMKDQITSLAEQIATFITGERSQMILFDELVLRYHVILAKQIVNISEIKPEGHRIASFRHDLFDTNDEYLSSFKDTLYKEVLKRREIRHDDIKDLLSEFLAEPTDVTRLSKLIGTVIKYKNGVLEFDRQTTKDFTQHLNPIYVSPSIVDEAVELAAREILSSLEFKVPAAFGNKDFTVRGSDEKIEKRLNDLASRITDLLDSYKSSNMVTIDESLGEAFLQLKGGIASAIGNLFVLDDSTKLMKITDNWESLEALAKRLYEKLKNQVHNLHEYKFCIKANKFPKLSFDCSEYEENLARDFLNKLLVYSNQADENGMEAILKSEIGEYQRDHPNYLHVSTDAIFLTYHDEIQKWWMQHKQAQYLTKHSKIFESAINNIINPRAPI